MVSKMVYFRLHWKLSLNHNISRPAFNPLGYCGFTQWIGADNKEGGSGGRGRVHSFWNRIYGRKEPGGGGDTLTVEPYLW